MSITSEQASRLHDLDDNYICNICEFEDIIRKKLNLDKIMNNKTREIDEDFIVTFKIPEFKFLDEFKIFYKNNEILNTLIIKENMNITLDDVYKIDDKIELTIEVNGKNVKKSSTTVVVENKQTYLIEFNTIDEDDVKLDKANNTDNTDYLTVGRLREILNEYEDSTLIGINGKTYGCDIINESNIKLQTQIKVISDSGDESFVKPEYLSNYKGYKIDESKEVLFFK